MVTVLFGFQNTTSVSLRPIFFLLAKSIFQGPTLPLSTHISQSFWCPISRSRHNEQCLLHPNLKVFCVQHPAWIPSNLRWILFFAQDTGVGGFFFFYYRSFPVLFPSIINDLVNGGFSCLWYPSKKKLGILSNYICSGQRGFTKIKRELAVDLLHTCLNYRVTDQECCKQKLIVFLENNVAKKWKVVKTDTWLVESSCRSSRL